MENTHTILYDSLELYITGYHEEAEEENDVKESFDVTKIEVNGINMFHWLLPNVIEEIGQIVLIENY